MLVLGIPLALPIFVLSFFLCFIPYIGGFISTGLALLVTIAVGTPTDIAIMVAWTLLFNLVTGNIVGPLVYGKTVHLHPAVVLVAIPAGSAIAGHRRHVPRRAADRCRRLDLAHGPGDHRPATPAGGDHLADASERAGTERTPAGADGRRLTGPKAPGASTPGTGAAARR